MDEKGVVACLVADGFEDSELLFPKERLENAGFTVELIGIDEAGTTIRGKRGAKMRLDHTLDEVRPQHYDALLIPGGHSPEKLRKDERALSFVRNFDLLKRPLWAICHGPQLLISAGLVRDRVMTAAASVQSELAAAGARVRDEPLVIDGNWHTSRNPRDADQFAWAFAARVLQEHGEVDVTAPVNPSVPAEGALGPEIHF